MENLSNMSTIKSLCERFGFSLSKNLGQNFLINPSVCPRIAQMGTTSENENENENENKNENKNENQNQNVGVIEIGTGFGVLTHELCKIAAKVVAIEIDEKLLPVLDFTMKEHYNLKIINSDVLKLDLNALINEEFPDMPVYICANLPYYITSPIIMKLLEDRLPVCAITVMVQREAAERLCAAPGTRECGALTIAVNYYATPKRMFNVSRGSFFPAPNVDSAVIRLDVKHISNESEKEKYIEKILFKLIKAAFSQRRKMMANPCAAAFSMKKEDFVLLMEKSDVKKTARAEELTLKQFKAIAQLIGCLQ